MSIGEVSCPETCDPPRGCFFKEEGSYYACQQCQRKVRKSFMGYDLSPYDLQSMLQHTTTPEVKPLKRKDGSEFSAKLMLDDKWKVKLAAKGSIETVEEKCPRCGSNLRIITSKSGKFLGCAGYPKCAYTKKFEEEQAVNSTEKLVESPLITAPVDDTLLSRPVLDASGNVAISILPQEAAIENVEAIDLPSNELVFDKDPLSEPQEVAAVENFELTETDKYQRIPRFVMELLQIRNDELSQTEITVTAPEISVVPEIVEPEIPPEALQGQKARNLELDLLNTNRDPIRKKPSIV